MIPLEEALKTRFSTSTREELVAYAKQAGHKHAPNIKTAALREGLLNTLGVPAQDLPAASQPRAIAARSSEVIPDYNLTPNGLWGGRRHRITLHKPSDAPKSCEGVPFQWNGKPQFFVTFGEPVDVPEPIYERMRELKRGTGKMKLLDNGEVETEFTHREVHAFNYHGVTPGTENLCGSIKEFYQAKGASWFHKLERRPMLQIMALIEKQPTVGRGEKERPMLDEELRGVLLQEFFGFSDAVDAEEVAKVA